MSYKSHDYTCQDCGYSYIELLPREEEPGPLECPQCKGTAERQFGAPMVLNASHRDGIGRFSNLKEQSKLRQEAAAQKARGNLKEAERIKKEIKKL